MRLDRNIAACVATCVLLVGCEQKPQEAEPVDTTLSKPSTSSEPWASYDAYAASADENPTDQNGASVSDDASMNAQMATQIIRIYGGPPATPIIDEDESAYRTRILQAAAEGVNFAGASTVVQIGCGTGCSFAYVINQQTGDVRPLGLGGEEQMYLTLVFEPDQRLMQASWETGDQCLRASYLWDDSELILLGEVRTYARIDGICDQTDG